MIRINLLPFRAARRKENIRQQASVFTLSFFLVLILMTWYHFSLGGRIDNLEGEISEKKDQLNRFIKINNEIAAIKKQLKDLNQKIDIIATLQANRQGPVRLLDAMTGIVVPKRMWFTSMEERQAKGGDGLATKVIAINGLALDNKTVADFMKRLEASKLFSSVNLITLRQDKSGGNLNLKNFSVNCNAISVATAEEKDKKTGTK